MLPSAPVEGKTALLVDDGIATGFTMKAAIFAIRQRNPAKVVVAAPVASRRVVEELRKLADEVVVPFTPTDFYAIGTHYADFKPVEEEEVVAAMTKPMRSRSTPTSPSLGCKETPLHVETESR